MNFKKNKYQQKAKKAQNESKNIRKEFEKLKNESMEIEKKYKNIMKQKDIKYNIWLMKCIQ